MNQVQDFSLSRPVGQTAAPDDGEVDLIALFAVLWRGKLTIFLVVCAAVLAGIVYGYGFATLKFTSQASVALITQQEQVVDIDSVISGITADEPGINTEIEVLRSRHLIGSLVDALGLQNDPEFNPSLVPIPLISLANLKSLVRHQVLGRPEREPLSADAQREVVIDNALRAISISNVRQSYVFRISALTTDPQKSAAIANSLAELYIVDQLEARFEATAKATEWLSARVAELKQELETSESQVREFNAATDLINYEALGALNRQLKELRDRRDTQIAALAGRQATLDGVTGLPPTASVAETAAALSDRSVSAAASQFAEGAITRSAFDLYVSDLVDRLQLDQERERAQIDAISDSIAELEDRIERQSSDLVTLQQLEREAEAAGVIYEYFLTRLKETSVQQGIQQADARVLSAAVVPRGPSEPRRALIVAVMVILGLIVGSVIVLVRELLTSTYRTAEDLESMTGVTVMGQIPVAPTSERRDLIDYVVKNPASAMVESIRNLRTSILMSNMDNPAQVVMLTSSVPAEGKTTQSIGLSQNIGAMGKKALLIEADIRRRTFTEYFKTDRRDGLFTAVTTDRPISDFVHREEGMGFDVLMGEDARVNAADFFSSASFSAFLARAREHYELIVIDTPPVLVVPDARVIAPLADAILYVVRWDKTTRSQVNAGLRSLAMVSAPVNGLILSQISPRGMKRYGYGEGYGAYASYGSEYYGAGRQSG